MGTLEPQQQENRLSFRGKYVCGTPWHDTGTARRILYTSRYRTGGQYLLQWHSRFLLMTSESAFGNWVTD